ncbi:MAG TPA: protein kinase [Gemmatimonadales bacterium]
MTIDQRLSAALADRYRIERELGRGGMAVVYLAEDLKHHRRVAIKLLRPELSAVVGSDRFLREIEIAATLQHPHILPLYDSGDAAGQLYYVMPFVEGESLRERLQRERQLPLDVALRFTREVGTALQYAHDHGVVHRDIKPENVMLSGNQAVVADFGIARALHAANADQLTLTGMAIGTPQYMSPEQASGERVDGRADQYSLACTLYEMLSGKPPFVGSTPLAVMAKHSAEPVPSVRDRREGIPSRVEKAIKRGMAKRPEDRFLSIQQLLDALDSPQTSAVVPFASHIRPKRGLFTAAAVLLFVILFWQMARRMNHPAPGAVASVAVLPFMTLAGAPDTSYLGLGMTDGLIADLAEVGALKVISRSSGAVAQGSAKSLADLSRELGVQGVVQGWIGKMADTVRVRLRFLRTTDSVPLFTKEYERRLGELPDLQREITTALIGSISANLKGTEQTRLEVRHEVDQRAYEAFLRGRFYLEQEELERAREQFEQASRIAPQWAPPYVGIANYYTALPFYSDTAPAVVLPQARAALTKALELDETLAEAHAVNAYLRAYYEWDWRAAEQEFRRALELRPNYADAYFSYSRFLASRRRLDEAIAQLGHAVELDPLSLSLQTNRALLYYFAGRYDDAQQQLMAVLKSDSTDRLARWGLALVAEQEGRVNETIASLERLGGKSLNTKASLGHAYGIAGKTAQARSILRLMQTEAEHSYVPSYFFALVYAGLGERDQALRYLERAYEERSTVLAYVRIDPRLASLREEPRFVALVERLGGQ